MVFKLVFVRLQIGKRDLLQFIYRFLSLSLSFSLFPSLSLSPSLSHSIRQKNCTKTQWSTAKVCPHLMIIILFMFFCIFLLFISSNLIIHLLVLTLYLVSSVSSSTHDVFKLRFFVVWKLQMVSTEWNFTIHKSPMLIESKANDPIVTVYYTHTKWKKKTFFFRI